MDSRDEELTIKNVDEQVERELAQLLTSQPLAVTSLTRTVRNLQAIYEEDRRLAQVWERINSHVPALESTTDPALDEVGSATGIQSLHLVGQTRYDEGPERKFQARARLRKVGPGEHTQKRRRWRNAALGLVAALLLITIFATILSRPVLPFISTQTGGQPDPTGTATSGALPAMHEYSGQYFKLLYPVNWTVAATTSESSAAYLQTVQFRPAKSSNTEINISALSAHNLPLTQLLHHDPDVQLGALENIHVVTYHGVAWTIGTVHLANASRGQANQLEIAYAQQNTTYRAELSATTATFAQSSAIFDAMLASLSPQSEPTVTPTATPMPTATSQPTRSTGGTEGVSTMKTYKNQYFTLQYPESWVITSDMTGGTAQQTVQFRPSATSSVYINVVALYKSGLSASQLLNTDTDVSLGQVLSTSTVTYHGIPWAVGVINLAGLVIIQPAKLEIAYANQAMPYKIEFSASPDTFDDYSPAFNAMFASFYPGS